jgi:outer membrane autotransporter protein
VQAWGRVWGGWNSNDGDGNAPGYDENQFGIWGGVDYAIDSVWFAGVAFGYFDSDMDFSRWGGVSGAQIDYDGGQVAVYGGYDNNTWYNRAILSFGWYSGSSHRNFAFDGPPIDPAGSPDADVVSFYNELGRRFGVGTGTTLTPFVGITIADASLDSFTERDPQKTGTALRVSGDATSVASIVGLRFNGDWGAFKPQLAVGWEHEFDDTSQSVTASFASAPSGSKFKVIGTDLGEDALVVEAGASYAAGSSSDFSVRYVGRWLSDYDAQSVMGRWTYKFGSAPVAMAPVMAEPLKLGSE